MKKLFLLIICPFIALSFTACHSVGNLAEQYQEIVNPQTTQAETISEKEDYVKAVWMTYYELETLIENRNETAFYDSINQVFKELEQMGFNTVTVQVRPCADAFYRSEYFPSSQYCFGKEGEEMPYDPLSVMCDCAHQNHLKIEAWINPYRVSQNNDIDALSDQNAAKQWYLDEEKKSNVYIDDSKIYFNPASDDVISLIVNGVEEIVSNYSVDGIHFDDYFYPTTEESIDAKEFNEYQASGGKLSLGDYRRDRVNTMIKEVRQKIKDIQPSVRFGISPAANIKSDYNNLYADVETWAGEEDFVDYICPQVYFGFKNLYQPFMFTVKKWIGISKNQLYIGLPLYKCSNPDPYAAEDDEERINEFVNNSDIIARQIVYLSKLDEVKGFYIFSYSYLSDENCKEEVENMLKIMKES